MHHMEPYPDYPVIDLKATGQNLRRLWREKGYRVADLQTYLGMEYPQAIYNWQSGRNLPSIDHLYAISKLLQVTVNDILVEQAA